MRKYFLTVIALLSTLGNSYAQGGFSDTLSYEIVHHNIIIKVKVNGKDARFIYDSGGIPLITASEAERLGIKSTGFRTTSDMNYKSAWQQKGILEDLEISPHYNRKQMETAISGDIAMFKNAGLAGLLNNQVFGQVVVSILPKEKKIVLTPYRPRGVNKSDGIPVRVLPNGTFVLPIQLGNEKKEAMFDTGFAGFLGIDNGIVKTMTETAALKVVDSYYGIPAMGIFGLPEPDTYFKLRIPQFRLGTQSISNVSSITHENRSNILGIDLLEYGNVILDIPRQMFYFYPFEHGLVDFKGSTKNWNVKILPTENNFQIGGVWGKIPGIQFGDVVTGINGKSFRDFPKDQYKVENFMNEIVGDTTTITIKKDGVEKTFSINRW